jgi:4-amino-4-deoxy-L-arabinose transferase-like glycosyltransferase
MSHRWVSAATWQSYLKVDRPFDFVSIERGLSATDVAPPLFFWLLHLWLLIFGSTTTTPMLLSIPISIVSALAITGLVRRVTGSLALGGAAALGWALTLPAWTLSNMGARPYDFLAMCSVLIVWQMLRFLDEDASRVWDTALLGLAFAAGMLTQYYFAITAVAVVVVVIVAALQRKEPYLIGRLVVAVGGAIVAFFALNPGWYHAVQNGQDRFGVVRSAYAFRQRLTHVAGTFAPGSWLESRVNAWALSPKSLAPGLQLRWVALFAVAVLVGLVMLLIARRDWFSRLSFEAWATMFVGVWTSSVTVLLYLGFVTPPWGMADRYMAATWALAAPALVVALNGLPKRWVSWGVAAWILLMAWGTFRPLVRVIEMPAPVLGEVQGVHRVVIDASRRGFVTRYMLELPGDAEVFVANQPELVADPGAWLSRIQPGDLYVHIPGGSGDNPVPLTDVLKGRFTLEPITGVTVERFTQPAR